MNRIFTPLNTAIALPQRVQFDPVDAARSLIVLGCALALILAGQPLPV